MDTSREARIRRSNRKLLNEAASKTKKCYFIGCKSPTIKAHSLSNKRLLLQLSDNGHVMYFDREAAFDGTLIETGRGKATVFSGFCGDHDKIFHPIDNEDYITNNVEQEYLFAMRAAAKEFTTREAVGSAIAARLVDDHSLDAQEFPLSNEGRELYEEFQRSYDVGTRDQAVTRGLFVDTFKKGKLNVIETAVIEAEGELPLAACVTFNMELDISGNLINDVSSEEKALGGRMKPCFMTVFPQGGKTYCLISYLRRDRGSYEFLHGLNDKDNTFKEVLISNLVAGYTENFVTNPTYWKGLNAEMIRRYHNVFGNSFKQEYASMIADKDFNLFPSRAENI